MKKMILPLLALLLAVGGAFATKSMKYRTTKWGLKSTVCTQGMLIDDKCGTSVTINGRCRVEFPDESQADAFDISDCETNPLYKQN